MGEWRGDLIASHRILFWSKCRPIRPGPLLFVYVLLVIVLTPNPAPGQPRRKALSSPRKTPAHRARHGLGVSPRGQRRWDLRQPLHRRGPRSLGTSRPMAPGTSTSTAAMTNDNECSMTPQPNPYAYPS